jgi:serine protease Do
MRHHVPLILLVKSIRSQFESRRRNDRHGCIGHSNESANFDAKRTRGNLTGRRTVRLIAGLVLSLSAQVAGQIPAIQSADSFQKKILHTISRVEPSVVFVAAMRTPPGQTFPQGADPFEVLSENRGLLSMTSECGLVIGTDDRSGSRAWLVLTGAELLRPLADPEQTENIALAIRTSTGLSLRATVLAADPIIGLAVLRVPTELPAPPMHWHAKSATMEISQPGRLVLLHDAPSPSGKNPGSVDIGLISNVIRLPVEPSRSESTLRSPHFLPGQYLAVSAYGIPTHSGVPVFDLEGELLGVIDALAVSAGEAPGKSLAIPCTGRWARLIASLEAGLEVEYGWLGLSGRSVTRRSARSGPGVEVTRIWPGGPADRAGIRRGDIILKIEGILISDDQDLQREIALFEPGATVEVSLDRATMSQQLTIEVTAGKWPVDEDPLRIVQKDRLRVWRGLRVDWPTGRREFLPGDSERIPKGVVVTEVQAESPVAAAGLKVGQFIEKVGERPVDSPAEFLSAVATWPDVVPLTVLEGGEVPVPLTAVRPD